MCRSFLGLRIRKKYLSLPFFFYPARHCYRSFSMSVLLESCYIFELLKENLLKVENTGKDFEFGGKLRNNAVSLASYNIYQVKGSMDFVQIHFCHIKRENTTEWIPRQRGQIKKGFFAKESFSFSTYLTRISKQI